MTEAHITEVANKAFDYVIAGGGTAGLTLAARLSEDPSITVAVLEAGSANLNDPNILILGQFGKTMGDPKYDWNFPTVKQPYCNNREFVWARGKGLGGSSSINFYAWIKPPAADMDAVEKLGNPGWGWESYSKYSKKSETFHEPTEEQLSIYPHTFNTKSRGHNGPIQISFPHMVHTIDEQFQSTLQNMGLKTIDDPYEGDINGTWISCANLDPKTYCRSYAATGYYLPNKDRPNFIVLTDATVTKVLFAERKSPDESLVATGLEFVYNFDPSQTRVVFATKEVILSMGTIKNPQILELSGIGRKDILDRLEVDIKIELPGVGENVQEHLYLGVSFELRDEIDHETYDLMQDPVYAAQQMKLHAERKGMHGVGVTSFAYFPLSAANHKKAPSLIAEVEREIEEQKKLGKLAPGLAEQLDIQLQNLKDDSIPDLEILAFPSFFTELSTPVPGKKYVTIRIVLNHPFSRGTIHAASQDPLQHPEIDPHYFENDFDLEMMVQHIKFIRSMVDVEPWKSTVACEIDPGPKCTTDDEIREYVKNFQITCWHTVGSCSMLPRGKQGVVDPELRVYGTQNLRIVDISVIPIHIAAHTHATAYAIGEKAADIIRGEQD
ncbi:GMC oxidoreductase [Ramaria rubella]|nr:GMC oxidoreductase [Ramaria rubella]